MKEKRKGEKSKIMDLWAKLKKITGQCAANTELENLKTIVETANNRIDKVLIGGSFLQSDSRVFEKLSRANEKLKIVGDVLEKVENVCLDLRAVSRIHEAIKVLDAENGSVIYKDPEKAARAFGDLFVGFGRLCRHLPSPAKEWGKFLEGTGDFFVNMNRQINPDLRWKDKWKQISRESGLSFP